MLLHVPQQARQSKNYRVLFSDLIGHKHALAIIVKFWQIMIELNSHFDRFIVLDSFARNCAIVRLLVLGMMFDPCAKAQETASIPDSPFLIRAWQRAQGLPNDRINAITQTHDGYLWLGTDEGLARFDGVNCRLFGVQDGLRNLQISSLMEDSQGVLWIGTSGGGLGRMVHDKITTYTVKDGLAGDSVSSFVEATNGDVWIGTHTGLSRWHDDKFFPEAKALEPMLVFDLANDRRGNIYAATLHQGLLRFCGETISVATGELGKITNNPRCVLVDSKDRVWAGMRNKTVLCFEKGIWTRFGTNDGLPNVEAVRLAEKPDGTIWAGSWNEGLYYFENGRFNPLHKKDGLTDDSVLSLFAGPGQYLWAGTLGGGLDRIGPKKLSGYHVRDDSSECQLRSLAQTTNGDIWVGTYGQSIYRWQGDQFEPIQGTLLREHALVEAMLATRDGSLWWGAGPGLYHLKNGKLIAYYNSPAWLAEDRVWSLCEDRDGGMWVGTYNGKVWLVNQVSGIPNSKEWLAKQGQATLLPGLPGKPVTSLVQETNGTLWIGSLGGGLTRLQNGKLTKITQQDGLQSDLIRSLLLDSEGTLWIGTDGGGLNRWANGQISHITTKQGLPDDIILQIVEDDTGCLWLGGNSGICRVSKRGLNDVADGKSTLVIPLNFGITDGMASEQCVGNFGAALKTQAGQLCFSTTRGIVVLDPTHQSLHTAEFPTVLLEDVLVDNQKIEMAALAGPNGNADHSTNSVFIIPAGKHNFDFHYAGIAFDKPETIGFRYRVEGLDASWNMVEHLRVAHYTYIPPGAYRFQVQACNINGQWSGPAAAASFVVLPYFWETRWFKWLLAAVLIALLAVGIRLIERRRYRMRLKRLEQQRDMENERVRIARDLHDELGSSLNYISMSIADIGQSQSTSVEQLKSTAQKISNFATRTARALDEIVWAVNPRNDSVFSLMEYMTQFAQELFENTAVRCRFQIADDLPNMPLVPEIRHNLFLIIKEALNNVLKHSQATEIFLGAKIATGQLQIFIQDNGVGFDLKTAQTDSKRNGLQNMRQRMESLGGRLTVETKPGTGTAISLTMDYPPSRAPQIKARD